MRRARRLLRGDEAYAYGGDLRYFKIRKTKKGSKMGIAKQAFRPSLLVAPPLSIKRPRGSLRNIKAY
jgi:hypothetical protein